MTTDTQETPDGTPDETTELNFDNWIADQPEQIAALIDGHVTGLRTALQSERDGRKGLERQLRDIAKQAEQGSQAQTQLLQVTQQLQEAERRASFVEAAAVAGMSGQNVKLAYLAATADNLFTADGLPDIDRLKSSYPNLFTKATPTPAAGAGANSKPRPGMNDWIRQQAGMG